MRSADGVGEQAWILSFKIFLSRSASEAQGLVPWQHFARHTFGPQGAFANSALEGRAWILGPWHEWIILTGAGLWAGEGLGAIFTGVGLARAGLGVGFYAGLIAVCLVGLGPIGFAALGLTGDGLACTHVGFETIIFIAGR